MRLRQLARHWKRTPVVTLSLVCEPDLSDPHQALPEVRSPKPSPTTAQNQTPTGRRRQGVSGRPRRGARDRCGRPAVLPRPDQFPHLVGAWRPLGGGRGNMGVTGGLAPGRRKSPPPPLKWENYPLAERFQAHTSSRTPKIEDHGTHCDGLPARSPLAQGGGGKPPGGPVGALGPEEAPPRQGH